MGRAGWHPRATEERWPAGRKCGATIQRVQRPPLRPYLQLRSPAPVLYPSPCRRASIRSPWVSVDISRLTAALAPLRAADPARPYVIAQLGQSLDGRIATASGESRYINGPSALDHLHALRAHVDAVIVGVGTIIADDPLLTVRRVAGRNPVRVVLDPRGRMPDSARCLRDAAAPVLVLGTRMPGTKNATNSLAIPIDSTGQMSVQAIIAALFQRGLRRLLVEGGPTTLSRFLDAGCVDRLHVLVAPVIIGSGKPGLALAPVSSLSHALRPPTTIYPLTGGDVLFDCDLRAARSPT